MRARCLLLPALLAALWLAGGAWAGEPRASSGRAFLQLLSEAVSQQPCPSAAIELTTNMTLSRAASTALGLALPLTLKANCTLTIRGAGAAARGRRAI